MRFVSNLPSRYDLPVVVAESVLYPRYELRGGCGPGRLRYAMIVGNFSQANFPPVRRVVEQGATTVCSKDDLRNTITRKRLYYFCRSQNLTNPNQLLKLLLEGYALQILEQICPLLNVGREANQPTTSKSRHHLLLRSCTIGTSPRGLHHRGCYATYTGVVIGGTSHSTDKNYGQTSTSRVRIQSSLPSGSHDAMGHH